MNRTQGIKCYEFKHGILLLHLEMEKMLCKIFVRAVNYIMISIHHIALLSY